MPEEDKKKTVEVVSLNKQKKENKSDEE